MSASPPRPTPIELLDVETVAATLGVCGRTVRDYVARGQLPAYRVAGSRLLRFKAVDVEALLVRVPATKAGR